MTPFAHLRSHTAYSLLEGALRITPRAQGEKKRSPLGLLCEERGIPALAITDRANLYGALEFSQVMAAEGVQPIIGCTMPILMEEEPAASHLQAERPVLAFLAKNEEGYRNLMRLSSEAFEQDPFTPALFLKSIKEKSEGLFCLTGGARGLLNEKLGEGQFEKAEHFLKRLVSIFPDRLYIELQRHGEEREEDLEPWLMERAAHYGLPLVATNEPYFASRSDFEAHDVFLSIASRQHVMSENRRRLTPEHYFKSGEEMAEVFKDIPEALSNALDLAKRCAFRPMIYESRPPRFLEIGAEAEAERLTRLAEEGLAMRLSAVPERALRKEEYEKRLHYELDVIKTMDFAGYFLIVADFVQWARKEKIPVGPGRGSGASSLVAYALTITDLDPLRFNLLFERFLNPERISMPDFDIDFCQERRDEVIRYLEKRYGQKRVAHIITFGTLQARAALRDVGRALGLPYGQVDRLCKFIPNDPAHPVPLAQAIAGEPLLQEEQARDEKVARLFETATALEGLYRHASTHAAGVVIGARPLDEDVPLCRDPRSGTILTQFSMSWAEKAGLVKFDLLGLKTLTALRLTMEFLEKRNVPLTLEQIPFDDPKTFALLGSGEMTGIFQMESGGMRDTLRNAKPDRFEDIIALVALYRPGPMDNIPRYIACKRGEEEPDYLHPLLKPVLEETFGVVVYQEQVMQIAQILSGYSLGEADILRRAMGKKIKSEMAQQKERFVEGAVKNEVDRQKAVSLFEMVARFAGYGFPKSHAAAYALLAYQTAYLKAHHPDAFLASLMTLDMGNPDKLALLLEEARRLGVKISPPDINRSLVRFAAHEGEILYALGAVRHVGGQAAALLVEERQKGGAFSDIFDFLHRVSAKALPKRAFESLAMAGVFDSIHPNRRQIKESVAHLLESFSRMQAEAETGQEALFGGGKAVKEGEMGEMERQILVNCEDWKSLERLEKEFEAAGLYLSGHPLKAVEERNSIPGLLSYQAFAESGQESARLAGVVTSIQKRTSRKGNAYAFLNLSDMSGSYEVLLFSDLWGKTRGFLEVGTLLTLEVDRDSDTRNGMRIKAQSIDILSKFIKERKQNQAAPVRDFRIVLERSEIPSSLKDAFQKGGIGRVILIVPTSSSGTSSGEEAEIRLPHGVSLTLERAEKLRALPGVRKVEEIRR